MAALGIVLHLGLLAWNVFAICQNLLVSRSDPFLGHSSYGGRWKFLTFLNQVIQTTFFGVCLLCDLLQLCLSNRNRFCSFLTRVKDCVFAALAFPIGAFVFTSFWSIYAYNRELVYPKEMDKVFAQWLNHAMHTLVFPVILIELFACPHQYPSKKNGLAFLAVFGISYVSWVHWVHYASDIWAYPILAKLDAVGKLVFFAASFLIVFTFYLLGEWLTRLRWGSGRPAGKKKRKNKSN